ncbi:MAG: nicotinate phosphoribosyltransferase [Candidatus Solibacter usitatus]|nr:nicotinate phosphoribosyltransferase [Candidatus Solibacter usitatus]
MSGLLTDLYELTMAAGYFEAGIASRTATFELSVRSLPKQRNFVLAAGLAQAVEYLQGLRFSREEIAYLRGLPQFARVSSRFFDMLGDFRFTGDVFAVPEGTPLFAGEPMMTIRAPLIEAQVPETYLLSALTFQTLIASKAARVVHAGGGRDIVEFGTRRAHTPEAGVLGARAAFIGGCVGTSNALAGYRYGIPVFGTAAHSWVMAFPNESESFRQLQKLLGAHTVQLIDTFDTIEGARKAAALGRPLWGVRLDSGDLASLAKQVRAILDQAGLRDARIMATSDLDEFKIHDILAAGAPVDVFGVGTELATSGDAPAMGAVYKLVEMDMGGIKRYTAKRSQGKMSTPGAKQVFRLADHDVLARSGECCGGGAEALLRPVILAGELVEPLPTLVDARKRAAECLAKLPPALRSLEVVEPFRVEHSAELIALTEQTSRNMP